MCQKDKMHSGELYLPMGEEILKEQFECLEKLYDYNSTRPGEFNKREKLLKEMFAEIGAGSIVTKDIPPNVVAVGNPCRVLREIDERDKEYYFKDRKIKE